MATLADIGKMMAEVTKGDPADPIFKIFLKGDTETLMPFFEKRAEEKGCPKFFKEATEALKKQEASLEKKITKQKEEEKAAKQEAKKLKQEEKKAE